MCSSPGALPIPRYVQVIQRYWRILMVLKMIDPFARPKEVAELHFLEAPHAYTPMGEAEEQSAHLGVAAKNRCWWSLGEQPSYINQHV